MLVTVLFDSDYVCLQYLEFSGFDKCTSVFQKECEQKSKPIATHGIKSKSNQKLVAIQVTAKH
jgi:hypothetical protein